jgi:hypothetical protein
MMSVRAPTLPRKLETGKWKMEIANWKMKAASGLRIANFPFRFSIPRFPVSIFRP